MPWSFRILIDYANGILMGITKKLINKLQLLMNRAAKVILNWGKYDSASKALFKLHWLPVEYRIKFKIVKLVYVTLHDSGPEYLLDLLKYNEYNYNTRSAHSGLLHVPRAGNVGV